MPEEKSKQQPSAMDDEEFLALARKRFEQAASDEESLRATFEEDIRFVAGDQWDAEVKKRRQQAKRPALTFNRMHTYVQSVANEARQMRGEITFTPGDNGSKDTATVLEGLARYIQYHSKARVAFETATDYAAGGGFGFFAFTTDYVDDDSFDLEIKVRTIPDPLAVYGALIPACLLQEPSFVFVVTTLAREEFEQEHPEIEISDWEEAKRTASDWIDESYVRVAEYWWTEAEEKTLYLLHDGTVTDEPQKGVAGYKRKRTVREKTIHSCMTNGVAKWDETTWPGKRIPIFAVLGKCMFKEGEPELFSVVRFQKDPQALINTYKSRIAETLGNAPVQPYIGVAGQFQGFENEWASMNTEPKAYLEYNAIDVDGKPCPAPRREVFEAPIAALSRAAADEVDDMKSTSGMYDASMGARGNETSGKAIMARQQQSNVTNMHFIDNLERAVVDAGMELAVVIPRVYDTPRVVRILGEDEKQALAKVNQPYFDDDKQQETQHAIGGDDAGRYDVTVQMKRAYSTRRMETNDMLSQAIQAVPGLFERVGDLFFRNSDMAGADQIADRLEKMLPPELRDQKPGEQAPIPPQVQQQMAQAQQMVTQLTQRVNELQRAAETKEIEARNRLEIEELHAATQVRIAAIKVGSAEGLALLAHEMKDVHELARSEQAERARQQGTAGAAGQGQASQGQPGSADASQGDPGAMGDPQDALMPPAGGDGDPLTDVAGMGEFQQPSL